MRFKPRVEHRPPWTTPAELAVLAVLLAFGVGAWTSLLNHLQATHDHGQLGLLPHWLRDSALAVPLVLNGVIIGRALARAVARRMLVRTGAAGGSALRVVFTAVGAAVGFAVTAPVRDLVFAEHTVGQTLAAQLREGTLVALAVALPLAAAAERLGVACTRQVVATADLADDTGARPRRRLLAAGAAFLTGVALTTAGAGTPVANAADPGAPCPTGAPLKHFDVTAINIKIPLNRFGDNDPSGKMYVLNSALAAARAEEASQKVSIGLRDDPIQPLSIRANEGDCVEINFTNAATGGNFGMHIDGLAFAAGSSGDKVGLNADSSVAPGGSATYRYYVPNDPTMEGSHYIRPGPGYRAAVDHGLFGTLTVEPPGSTYLDANTGAPLQSGWEAIIVPGNGGVAFREFVLMHHEVGNDNEVIYDKNGASLPQVDDTTGSYRPGEFSLNYRSEPFRNRLLDHPTEKSHAYSSYTFGDPSTPLPRGYLADPTKFRIVHASGEKFHVFHLHGGGDRWRANPLADPTFTYSDTGLNKDPQAKQSQSTRLDSQSLGPGESYNLEIEGGAGGVQQSVGDFLYHCHISKHYLSGMWSVWRVYNNLQPDLFPVPGRVAPAVPVDSAGLIGRTMADGTVITAANLESWVRPMLPPQGVTQNNQDASIWDYTVDKSDPTRPVFLGEPEDLTDYPNSTKAIAGHPNLQLGDALIGNRPVILFDPVSGRPSYPLLRTHIGKRPPFSPGGHSGAPYLGDNVGAAKQGTVDPYAKRADGLCPANRTLRTFNVVTIEKEIRRNSIDVDTEGKIFVLAKYKDAVRAGSYPDDPLAIRVNQGDCVAITLTNEMTDAGAFDNFSKTSMHIHHVQFDVQGSDGVTAGFAFEHSIRPFKVEDPTISTFVAPGDTTLTLSNTAKFQVGEYIGAGLGTENIEIRRITAIVGNTLTLDTPFTKAHLDGEWAGAEFIQYRWYPDVLLDNVFWHDHVDGIHGWGHGLVGQLIVEPPGSTYHDPRTGDQVDSGTIVDIHTNSALAPGVVNGSFRELALWTMNDNDEDEYSTLNMRSAPLDRRQDTNNRFSSYMYGDPSTPMPRAYPGDPVVVRTINVSTTVDTLHFNDARYLTEYRMTDAAGNHISSLSDTQHQLVSEKYTMIIDGGAGGPRHQPGDYLYFNGDERRMQQGAWGLMRVLNGTSTDLKPLPDNTPPAGTYVPPRVTGAAPPAATGPGNPCPTTAPVRNFAVSAVDLPSGNNVLGAFIPTSQSAQVKAGTIKPEPLALHVAAGECVRIAVKNERNGRGVSFALSKLDRDVGSFGVNAGFNPQQNIAAGATRTYVYYADSERIGTATIADLAGEDNLKLRDAGPPVATKRGFYGALTVAPAGATFTDPVTGAAKDIGTQVDVHVAGTSGYRDVTLIMADDDPQIGQDQMPYPTNALQNKSFINYRFAPVGDGPGAFAGTPATPLIRAYPGDPLLIHEVIAPGSEQGHVFSLGGMSAPRDRFIPGSERTENQGLGPYSTFDAQVIGGAGGVNHTVGDFFYGDLRRPFTQVGLWGIARVISDPLCPIRPLDGRGCTG